MSVLRLTDIVLNNVWAIKNSNSHGPDSIYEGGSSFSSDSSVSDNSYTTHKVSGKIRNEDRYKLRLCAGGLTYSVVTDRPTAL